MKADRCFSPSIIAVAFCAFAIVMGCSRAAPAGKQSSSETATLNAECNQGMYLACSSLGTKYLAGTEVAKDDSRAPALFQRSCDGGNAQGCALLGLIYQMGWGGLPKDIAHALNLYRTACDGGLASGRASLGDSYRYAHGVAKDITRAAPFYQKARQTGLSSACDDAASLH
jgi:uncharacterized protein